MPGRGQTVAAHAAVVLVFVGSLSERGETYDRAAGSDMRVIDHVASAQSGRDGAVDDDRAHQIAHVGRLAARRAYLETLIAHLLKELFRAVDDGRDDLAGDQVLVAPDRRRQQYVSGHADAQQVVGVHHDRVLSDAFPYRCVARLAPVGVGERRLGSRSVGVHDEACLRIARERVRDDFAEGFRIKALIDMADGRVHVLFRGGYSPSGVA